MCNLISEDKPLSTEHYVNNAAFVYIFVIFRKYLPIEHETYQIKYIKHESN